MTRVRWTDPCDRPCWGRAKPQVAPWPVREDSCPGASWSSDVTHVYADRGYVSRAANPNNNVSSSTRYYPNGSTTGSTFSTAA